MNLFAVSGLSVGLSCIILSLIALFFGKTKVHRLLMYFNIAVAVWGFGIFLAGNADSKAIAIIAWKITALGGILIAPLFYHFVSCFCGNIRKKIIYISYMQVAFTIVAIIWTTYFIDKLRYVDGLYYFVGNQLVSIVLIIYFSLVILSYNELFRFLKKTRGHQRLQTQYIIIGFMFGFTGGALTFLPAYEIDIFYSFGNFGITLYTLILGYAIFRHRLMDLHLIFRRTMVYSISTGLVAGLFVLLVLFMTGYIEASAGLSSWTVNIIAALITAALFNPLKNSIQVLIDRVFYKTSYNYYAAIQKTGAELVTLIKLDDIQQYILNVIIHTLKIKSAYFMLKDENGFKAGCFAFPNGSTAENITVQKIDNESALVELFKSGKDVVVRDELREFVEPDKIDMIAVELSRINSEVAIPVFIENELVFILILGEKLSGDIYSDEDISLLSTISNQAAISLKNAMFYNELEQRVRDRTEELSTANAKLKNEIIERKRTEAELKGFAGKLEQSNKELEDFAKIASHDLQEPLWKVKMFGDLLKAGYMSTLGEKGKEYLGIMYDSITRMQQLINDILALAGVTTMAQSESSVDLNKVIEEVLIDLEVRIQQLNARIEVDDMPVVVADPLHMRQIFQNLIGNALKYHSNDRIPLIIISSQINDADCQGADIGCLSKKLLTFTVEDNGIGFDNNYNDYIFGVFLRLHGLDEYEGTGMGLAICRKIVERYGGNITAKGMEGQGAAFTVNLPVKQIVRDTDIKQSAWF